MKAVFVRLFGCSRKSNRGDQGGRGGGNDHFIIQHCPTGVPVTVPVRGGGGGRRRGGG
eukprot:CAMPEP_0170959164 /NCGR_PEP_ID=MMETSP0735-20130129/36191_1 /TAXON_ID=186038 /ORGANISM="Fragilariopsis kerguelensis, Strain L26-C5" /LENGTH=57 /DNA_ID=CAMNT_0011373333 /DNA_START=75 /DNA_END=245 /DNA_ORIENTATION=-